jgi:hypothetical protein
MLPVIELGRSHRDSHGLGPALYRAGKLQDALLELEQSAPASTGLAQCRIWLFLAMTHERLGHAASARQFLAKARDSIEEADRNDTLYDDRLQQTEFQILRREAEDQMKPKEK